LEVEADSRGGILSFEWLNINEGWDAQHLAFLALSKDRQDIGLSDFSRSDHRIIYNDATMTVRKGCGYIVSA
jgi:hypothetical protein